MISKTKLGQLLLDSKIITQEQLNQALAEQQKTGEMLGFTLQRLGFVEEEAIYMPVLAQQIGVEFANLRSLNIPLEAIAKIPAKLAGHYKVMPIRFEKNTLSVAMTKPLDIHTLDELALAVESKIKPVLASEKDILEAIRKYYGVGAETIEQMMDTIQSEQASDKKVKDLEETDEDASISKFFNQILLEAYKDKASDIHIEPFEDELKVRYRVDGVLYDAQVPSDIKHFKDSINSRIKILSNLNIAEKRLPQDGRFKVRVGDVDLDLRVSFLPSAFGESVVIRLLSSTRLYSFDELGLSKEEQHFLDRMISKPHGIIFITGPTGSGKSTTLYSCLAKINTVDKKIITIEDPIEYQLQGIIQIQINPRIGLTFASGLRSMLRHDPDIMMVGEVRDFETAEVAIRIALTGHLVLSTLHTNDAASAVTRLLDMGIESFLIASSVNCIIAQRLVRRICPKCRTTAFASPEMIQELGVEEKNLAEITVYEGKGCEACRFTGYLGRESIFEFLIITDEIRDLILARVSASQVKQKAVEQGMKTLRQSGWEKVKRGITTASEVIGVTKEE